MGKITIIIDSVIQTKKDIEHFTKCVVNKIKNNDMLENVVIDTVEHRDGYILKIHLPEII